jgi:hypothetical protein
VEINPGTGSILVHYDPESSHEIHSIIQEAGESDLMLGGAPELTEADDIAAKIEKEAEFLAAHSEVALHVVNSVKALNREIRAATGNTVDLKVLLPAGLAVWAFMKAGAEVATPLWVTLAIFSFNSFVSLHSHSSVHITTQEMRVDRPNPSQA